LNWFFKGPKKNSSKTTKTLLDGIKKTQLSDKKDHSPSSQRKLTSATWIKDKSTSFLKQFMKVKKVKTAIQKFKENIVFRKPEHLNSFHYNIINDRSFVPEETQTFPEIVD